MKLSNKSQHAIQAMMYIALYGQQNPIALDDISHCQKISVSYLTQLFVKLRKAGLIKGIYGPGGGYCLGKPSSQITIACILIAIKPMNKIQDEDGIFEGFAKGETNYLASTLWNDLNLKIFNFLNHITLFELLPKT